MDCKETQGLWFISDSLYREVAQAEFLTTNGVCIPAVVVDCDDFPVMQQNDAPEMFGPERLFGLLESGPVPFQLIARGNSPFRPVRLPWNTPLPVWNTGRSSTPSMLAAVTRFVSLSFMPVTAVLPTAPCLFSIFLAE